MDKENRLIFQGIDELGSGDVGNRKLEIRNLEEGSRNERAGIIEDLDLVGVAKIQNDLEDEFNLDLSIGFVHYPYLGMDIKLFDGRIEIKKVDGNVVVVEKTKNKKMEWIDTEYSLVDCKERLGDLLKKIRGFVEKD